MHNSSVSPANFPEYLTVNTAARVPGVKYEKFLTNLTNKKVVKSYLLKTFGKRCSVCSRVSPKPTIEHIIDKSIDVTLINCKSNLALACNECNLPPDVYKPVLSAYSDIFLPDLFQVASDGLILQNISSNLNLVVEIVNTLDYYARGINCDDVKKFRATKLQEYSLSEKLVLKDYNVVTKCSINPDYDVSTIIPFLLIQFLDKYGYFDEAYHVFEIYLERGK